MWSGAQAEAGSNWSDSQRCTQGATRWHFSTHRFEISHVTGLARDPAWVHPRTLAEINRGAIAARRVVVSLGGTARFTELIEAGATEHSLRAALREGALIRPH